LGERGARKPVAEGGLGSGATDRSLRTAGAAVLVTVLWPVWESRSRTAAQVNGRVHSPPNTVSVAAAHSRAHTRMQTMASGTVKWFNFTKGFGFIQPDSGGKDVFVHISAVERAGLNGLNEGQKISYEIQTERGREAAVNLKA
jgi:cold shock protein